MAVAAAIDPKKAMAKNLVLVKTALRRASKRGVRVGFAFAPGKDKRSHLLMIDPRKNAKALMAEIKKTHKDRKVLCCGTATVVDENGKKTLSIIYVKKLAGAERKMQDALKFMSLRYLVKLESDHEVEDIPEAAEDDVDAEDETADDADEAADDAGDEDEDEDDTTAEADDDAEEDEDTDQDADEDEAEDEDETEDEDASDSEDDDRGATDAEGGDGEEEHPPGVEDATAPPPVSATKLAAIGAAPKIWSQTQAAMSSSVDKLKASIKAEYASESPELIADIDNSLAQLDQVVARFDQSLAQQLQKAHQAPDEATRKAELAKAKAMVANHIKYVASEPLIAHIDSNPFGVETNLKKVLTASLTHMAKVIS